jgi:hypothetical protein
VIASPSCVLCTSGILAFHFVLKQWRISAGHLIGYEWFCVKYLKLHLRSWTYCKQLTRRSGFGSSSHISVYTLLTVQNERLSHVRVDGMT